MVYMAKAPGNPSDWDGSGNVWFKIDEWGPSFSYGSISWPQLGMYSPNLFAAQPGLHCGWTDTNHFARCLAIRVHRS